MVNSTSIKTYSGIWFDILNPRVEDVDIKDIAHSLSQLARFNGHTVKPYYVGQHCLYVSKVAGKLDLEGLLHDSSEAYVGDLVNPLKRAKGLERYIEIEDNILKVIGEKFGCVLCPMAPEIHFADKRLLATEQRDLMIDHEVTVPFKPFDWPVLPLGQEQIEIKYLNRFRKLLKERKEGK